MKQFKAFLRKEFKHIFRDPVTILILLVMPVLLICLFGFAISTEVRGTRAVILDQLKNSESIRIAQRIHANNYFDVVGYPEDVTQVDHIFKEGKADIAVIISRNEGVQILADGSEPNQAQTRVSYMMMILMPHAKGLSINSRMLFNPQLKSEYNFVPGVIGMILMLICVMMTSISIVKEKETGTMEILLASPLQPITIITAKLVPFLVVSSANLVTILLLSYFVLGVPIAGSITLFFIITLLYIIVSLALGLLISTAVSSQLAAMLLSLLTIVPAIYLSGMIFPIESMPKAAQYISAIIPTRWYIDAARRILIQGTEFKYMVEDFIIISSEAVAFIVISIKLFKTRL